MTYSNNYLNRIRYGFALGGYNDSDAPAVSQDVKIVNNFFNGVVENDRNPAFVVDSYQGNSIKHTEGLVLSGNQFKNGDVSLYNTKRVNIQGNISLDDSRIRTQSGTTGLVANNTAGFSNSASGVVDGGNNVSA